MHLRRLKIIEMFNEMTKGVLVSLTGKGKSTDEFHFVWYLVEQTVKNKNESKFSLPIIPKCPILV